MTKQKLQLIALILIGVSILLKILGGLNFLAPVAGIVNFLALITALVAVVLAFWLITRNAKH